MNAMNQNTGVAVGTPSSSGSAPTPAPAATPNASSSSDAIKNNIEIETVVATIPVSDYTPTQKEVTITN